MYYDFIQNIIITRGQWNIPEGEYFEPHHIIPKSLGGLPLHYDKNKKNKHPNIIWLTAAEHLQAHKLLAEEHSNDKKLIFCYLAMCNKHPNLITPEEYERCKKLMSDSMKGKKWSENSKLKLSNSCKGKFLGSKNGMYGKKGKLHPRYGKKLSKEQIEKIANKHRGKKWPEISKQKLRDAAKKIPNYGNRGGTISEKQKQIIIEKNSKKVICLETNKEYSSLKEAANELKVSQSIICLVCKRKRKNVRRQTV